MTCASGSSVHIDVGFPGSMLDFIVFLFKEVLSKKTERPVERELSDYALNNREKVPG